MKRSPSPYATALIALIAASACSTEVEVPDDPTANSALLCEGFDNDAPASVTIRLANPTSEPIHVVRDLASGAAGDLFDIVDASSEVVNTGFSSCSCEEQQTNAQACSYGWGGPNYEIVTIPPGGQYDLEWDGRIAEQVDMPSSCFADQINDWDSCRQLRLAPAGTYTAELEVVMGTLEGCADGACTCPPDVAFCTGSSFSVDYDDSMTLSAAFDPGDGMVVLSP